MAGNDSAVKVHIDHVVKKFNGRNGEMVALNGVDMDIHENEFICVVGPSGCGKSTLLNIIGGLETPTEGKVLVDGKEVTGPGPDRGIVFQQYALFPWLTVEKNVQFGLKLQGKSKEEAEELAHKYLKMVDLEGFAKAYPKELSGGIVGQGVMSILGAFFGGLPAATYSQNVGIVTVNRVINRAVFALAALILLVAGLVPKFASLLTTIPQCVIGGATISVFATITMTGIRMITEGGFTPRKSSVVGLSVALGVGITQVSGCLAGEGFPAWVNTVFGSSSVVVAALMAILLNLILPKEPSANG